MKVAGAGKIWPGGERSADRPDAVAQGARGAITDRKAGFRSPGDAWADTTTSHGRLMLPSYLAEFERDLIRTRTGEGRAPALARGQKMGRCINSLRTSGGAIKRRDWGDESLAEIGRSKQCQRGDNFTVRDLSLITPPAAIQLSICTTTTG